MRVSEERLTTVLTQSAPPFDLARYDPVAALVLESMAAARTLHSDEIRHAGSFLLAVLGAAEPDATRLSIPIAMQVLAREEGVSPARARAFLGEAGDGDPLLRLSIDALTWRSITSGRRRRPDEVEAVAQVIYLLLRMFGSQEEADALDEALER